MYSGYHFVGGTLRSGWVLETDGRQSRCNLLMMEMQGWEGKGQQGRSQGHGLDHFCVFASGCVGMCWPPLPLVLEQSLSQASTSSSKMRKRGNFDFRQKILAANLEPVSPAAIATGL